MKFQYIFRWCLILSYVLFLFSLGTTAQTGPSASVPPQKSAEKGLFDSDEPLPITLKGNLKPILSDRSEEAPKPHPLVLSYMKQDSSKMEIPVEVKTRGHFRRLRENCSFPPLLIQFKPQGAQLNTIFNEQSKLKLVMPCKTDEFVIREWLVYRIYNLVSPKSFRARLVKVTMEDEKSKKAASPFYGVLLEEEKQMAKRNESVSFERKLVPEQTETEAFTTMAVFQYLIGNTDWSIQYMQNIKFIAKDSNSVAITVPYDFDHAGIVGAPYALPAEELQMSSVRERRYRGYCVQDMKAFDNAIALFNKLKPDIYGLYTNCTLLDAKYVKSTVQYLDAFYATINNPKAVQKEFGYPCDKNGTGNVVIKGLKTE